jgi:3-oxoadipate enol-lactonase
MTFVDVDGARFRVLDRGTGLPILLVHGFPLDHSMWNEQIEILSAEHRVIAPDLRCCGESPDATGTVTMEQMADDMIGVLDALGVDEPVVFCGLSMGGYVAWQFWRKYPTRLRALVLCDTRSQGDSTEAAQSRQKMIDHLLRAGTQYVAEAMLPRLFAAATFDKLPDTVARIKSKILAARPQSVAAVLRGLMARPDFTGHLPAIQVPTLVMVGDQDAISAPAEMEAMAGAIPGARFKVVPDAGHMPPLENPAVFNAELRRFLAEIAP